MFLNKGKIQSLKQDQRIQFTGDCILFMEFVQSARIIALLKFQKNRMIGIVLDNIDRYYNFLIGHIISNAVHAMKTLSFQGSRNLFYSGISWNCSSVSW